MTAATGTLSAKQLQELADSGEVVIGVKFDQPGIGFKGVADDMPVGFDPELATRAAHAVVVGDGLEFDAPDFWDGSAADRMARRLRLSLGLQQPKATRGLEVVEPQT